MASQSQPVLSSYRSETEMTAETLILPGAKYEISGFYIGTPPPPGVSPLKYLKNMPRGIPIHNFSLPGYTWTMP